MNNILWHFEQALIKSLKHDTSLMVLVNGVFRVIPSSASLPIIKIGKTSMRQFNTSSTNGANLQVVIEIYTQENNIETLLNICDRVHLNLSQKLEINYYDIAWNKIKSTEIEEDRDGKTFKASIVVEYYIEEQK